MARSSARAAAIAAFLPALLGVLFAGQAMAEQAAADTTRADLFAPVAAQIAAREVAIGNERAGGKPPTPRLLTSRSAGI